MMRFLHVSIIWGGTGKSAEQLAVILDLAEDWYSYGNAFYILYTSENLYLWQRRFGAIIDQPRDSFIISEIIDVHNVSGWMKQPFWDWLRSDRSNPPQIGGGSSTAVPVPRIPPSLE